MSITQRDYFYSSYSIDWRFDNFQIQKKGIFIKTEDPVIIMVNTLNDGDSKGGPGYEMAIIYPLNVLGSLYVDKGVCHQYSPLEMVFKGVFR